jgi:iron complex transport system substrate-binding protein
VHVEEWDDPIITAIRWVAELVELAGGTYVHGARSLAHAAKDRIVSIEEVVASRPDVIVASWCGKPVNASAIRARPGFLTLPAVREGRVHELPASILLQPGPAALGDGLDAMHRLITAAAVAR